MHQCLRIVEVQRTIFREVYCQLGGRATLARLARTCRAFNNAALDSLWAELGLFVYLIRCLPRDLWKVAEGKLSFQRPMSLRDWEIFMKYASRIRALCPSCVSDYLLAQSMNLGDDVIFALSNPPTHGPLIPYLKKLHWYYTNRRHASLLRLMLAPCLVDLSLHRFILCTPEISILTCIGTVCSSLKTLSITSHKSFGAPDAKGGNILCEALSRLHSLESLTCLALDETAIVNLSRLPQLLDLSLELQSSFESEKARPFMIPPAFASVKSLKLRAHALSTLTSLLEPMCIKPHTVSFVMAITPTPDALRLFFTALVSACDSEELTSISLTSFDERQGGVETQQITLSTFQPLFALPNIKSFEFDAPCDIAFDDDAITTLSKHWPKLTMLSLNAKCGWGINSSVTHQGLITLLSHCPALSSFGLAIDFTEIDGSPIPETRIGNGVTNDKCVRVDFVTSSITFPMKIAAFLSDVLPNLEEVETAWDGMVTIGTRVSLEEMARYREKWAEVCNLLPVFSAVRKQCMDWAAKEAQEESVTPAYFPISRG